MHAGCLGRKLKAVDIPAHLTLVNKATYYVLYVSMSVWMLSDNVNTVIHCDSTTVF